MVCQTLRGGQKECRTIGERRKENIQRSQNRLNRRNYGGTGGSVTTEASITQGPACEPQGAYYAEYYAWESAKQGGNFGNIKLKGLKPSFRTKRRRFTPTAAAGR